MFETLFCKLSRYRFLDFCICFAYCYFNIKVRQPPRPSQSLFRTSSCVIIVADLSRSSTDVRFSKILRLFLESTSRTQLCKATHPPQNTSKHIHTNTHTHINCSSFLTNITELTSYPRAYEAECHCNGIFAGRRAEIPPSCLSRAKDKDCRVPVALHWYAVSFVVFCNPVPPDLIERVTRLDRPLYL